MLTPLRSMRCIGHHHHHGHGWRRLVPSKCLANNSAGRRSCGRDDSDQPNRTPRRGRLHTDRDHHVHLGGAVPSSLICDWIRGGELTLEDEIPDLAAASEPGRPGRRVPKITVGEALSRYRGVDGTERDAFLRAYDAFAYDSLPIFLTMYGAYSRRELVKRHAKEIARGERMHPAADVRMSVPHPKGGNDESPSRYAGRAIEEMRHFFGCLLPDQRLFVNFPRQTFNLDRNREYFSAFVNMLGSVSPGTNAELQWPESEAHLAFDFSGQPLPFSRTIPLLEELRNVFPSAYVTYHHGEVCPNIPFSDRVRDAKILLRYIDRMGHGLCLGLAVLGIDPDDPGSENEEQLQNNKAVAYECLHHMAEMSVGIEVSPTCNVTLGGARDVHTLRKYVNEFLEAGVDVYVGTDDPGFMGTTLRTEMAIVE